MSDTQGFFIVFLLLKWKPLFKGGQTKGLRRLVTDFYPLRSSGIPGALIEYHEPVSKSL